MKKECLQYTSIVWGCNEVNLYVLQISRDYVLGSAGANLTISLLLMRGGWLHYFKKLFQIPHGTFNFGLADLKNVHIYYF